MRKLCAHLTKQRKISCARGCNQVRKLQLPALFDVNHFRHVVDFKDRRGVGSTKKLSILFYNFGGILAPKLRQRFIAIGCDIQAPVDVFFRDNGPASNGCFQSFSSFRNMTWVVPISSVGCQ